VADSIQLFIHPYPQSDFSGDKLQDCEPMTVNFTRTEASSIPMSSLSFDWDFGNGQTSTDANPAAVKYANWGTFNVRLVVNNTAGNCSTTVNKPAYIEVWPVPVAGFRSDPTFYTTIALPKFQFFNQSAIADQSTLRYEWNFGTGNPNDSSRRRDPAFSYGKDTATYDVRLIAISDKGCRDTIVRKVQIGPDIIVFVPNAFTPDASGPTGNDRFTAYVQNYKTFRMTVYNRWGEKLYETTDASAGWDGKANGVLCQQEVYSYLIEVTSFEDKLYKFTGTLTLLR
jgi:gliding motility-associated-like protein